MQFNITQSFDLLEMFLLVSKVSVGSNISLLPSKKSNAKSHATTVNKPGSIQKTKTKQTMGAKLFVCSSVITDNDQS